MRGLFHVLCISSIMYFMYYVFYVYNMLNAYEEYAILNYAVSIASLEL